MKYLKIIFEDTTSVVIATLPVLLIGGMIWLSLNYKWLAWAILIIIIIGLYVWSVYERAKEQNE